MSDLEDEIAADERYGELQREYTVLARRLHKEKRSKDDVVEATLKAARAAFLAVRIPPVKSPPKDSRRSPEVAAVVLSDWQLGKITPDYNSDICEQRIELLGDKLIELVNIQRSHHPVKELRVWLVGDIVEGEDIFPGQFELIDSSLYQQQVRATEILTKFLRKMLANFESIHVVGIIGNHGRTGRKGQMSVETNSDRLAYTFTKMRLEDETRITWEIPEGNLDHWYGIDKVGEKAFFLWHGYNIKGSMGLPWYGYYKKVLGWAVGGITEHFDYAISGHYHQAASFPINTKMVYVNGSTESHNSFASEMLASVGFPCQWLLFIHPKRGITAEYRVWLGDTDGKKT